MDPRLEAILKLTDLAIMIANRIKEVSAMSEEEARLELAAAKDLTDQLVGSVVRKS